MIKSLLLLPLVVLSCKTSNYKADFDIKAHKDLNITKRDKFYVVAADNNESTKRIAESFRKYYGSLNQAIAKNEAEADVVVKVNSVVTDKKRINITETVKESAKKLAHLEKPVKEVENKKYTWVKAEYRKVRPNANEPKVSVSEMEVETTSIKEHNYKYVEKFLNTLHNAKESVKKSFSW